MSDQGMSGRANAVRDWADRLQQRLAILGFPYAVIKKYGDDQGSRHAAMLTYYGFLSIFPLLLLVVVVLTMVLQGNAELRAQVIDAVVPAQFQETVDNALLALPSGGLPLAIGVIALLFSGLGIVFSAYNTLNAVANVPHRKRIPFFPRYLRIVVMLALLVIGVAGIGVLTVVAGALPDVPGLSRVASTVGTVALVFLLLWASVDLLLPHRARLSIVWPACLLGALIVTAVLTFGAVVLPRFVERSGAVYGSFATIVGMFSLLYIVSQALLFAAELVMVRRRRLWPRGLDAEAPTEADRRALLLIAREQERTKIERVEIRFEAPD